MGLKRNIEKIETKYYVYTGLVIGAIIGLLAYVQDWL